MAVILTLGLAQNMARAQEVPNKREGSGPQTSPTKPPEARPAAGPVGAPVTIDQLGLKVEADTTMAHMDLLMKQSLALSKSFAELAALHHGADRSEILMMERVSDAMGSMAAELKSTLAQYKKMLDDETSSETGAMKAEVDGLNAAMQVIAGEVTDAIQTLHRLEGQLGQG
ncbi:MAG TPA: hypothetical protein VFH33_07990 [Candidatus Krumholzibacteria bacterium]|nr:hypothetical protein [Candidatus Krumholzibacteria bacterium]